MTGDWLDIALVVAGVAFAVSGYRQGFLVGLLSFVGFLGGAVVGVLLAPSLVGLVTSSDRLVPLLGIMLVFLCASLGQVLTTWMAGMLRQRVTWRPAQRADAILGGVTSIVGFVLVAWLIGTAVAHSPLRALGSQVRHSAILTTVDDAMPTAAEGWFASFQRMFDRSGVPQVFGGLGLERIREVAAPDPAVLKTRAGQVAQQSTVRVVGAASCDRTVQGSGFPVAPQHIMTNAHVVAGVTHPVVTTPTGKEYDATVVFYDPERDVAILNVPGLPLAALPIGDPVGTSAQGIVAGYPGGGALTIAPARVRDRIQVRGPDIYHRRETTREIYSLNTVVRPGNSGGPLLAADGSVLGIVFAESLEDPNTGYAVTAAEFASDLATGRAATKPVSTGACAAE
ncbi:MAG: serine protease [Frankiales bacterium]|nr:serine protease [Frankiales bacterium]